MRWLAANPRGQFVAVRRTLNSRDCCTTSASVGSERSRVAFH
jgi:hypothetical protein